MESFLKKASTLTLIRYQQEWTVYLIFSPRWKLGICAIIATVTTIGHSLEYNRNRIGRSHTQSSSSSKPKSTKRLRVGNQIQKLRKAQLGFQFRQLVSSVGEKMEGAVDHLAFEREKAQFDVDEMKIVWAGSRHEFELSDRISRLVASDPVKNPPLSSLLLKMNASPYY